MKHDIQTNGQLTPITRWHGQIVDGRHRYSACVSIGLSPKFEDLPEELTEAEVQSRTISLNLHRRQLTLEQRAAIAAKLTTTARGANQHTAAAVSQAKAAQLLGVSVDSLQRMQRVQRAGIADLLEQVTNGDISIAEATKIAILSAPKQRQALAKLQASIRQATLQKNKADRQAKRSEAADFQTQKFPDQRFDLLLIDPPWDYQNDGETTTANPKRHYPTLTQAELTSLPVKELSERDALVFLWATSYHLEDALALLQTWGFAYNTSFVWVKPHHVVGGGIFKMSHEFLIVGKRGRGLGKPAKLFSSWLEQPRAKVHSTKPLAFQSMLQTMFPNATKVELFARAQRGGWTAWGNQKQKPPKT